MSVTSARLRVVEHRRIDVEAHRHVDPLAGAAAPAWSKQKQAILSKYLPAEKGTTL